MIQKNPGMAWGAVMRPMPFALQDETIMYQIPRPPDTHPLHDSQSRLRHARLDALHELFAHRHLPHRQLQGEEKEGSGYFANGILSKYRKGNSHFDGQLPTI